MAADLLLIWPTFNLKQFEVTRMKCKHDECSCQAAAGQQYCSNECESDNRDEGATECHCGHEECVASRSSHRDST